MKLNARLLLAGLALVAVRTWAGDDLYINPRPFGPAQAAFPANCVISNDGKWVAFMRGADSSISVWSLADGNRAWSKSYPCGSHRVAFGRRKPDVLVCITGKGFVGIRYADNAWKEDHVTPLGLEPKASRKTSPSPIAGGLRSVFFVEDGKSYCAKKNGAPPKPLDEKKRETSYHTLDLAYTGTAFAKLKPFETTILSGKGTEVIKAIALAGSPDGNLLLVATNAMFDSGKASLAIYDRKTRKRVSKFSVSKGPQRPLLEAFFSWDSQLLVTVQGKRYVVIRDARSGKARQQIAVYRTGYALSAALTPDGKHLVTCGTRSDGPGILIWDRK